MNDFKREFEDLKDWLDKPTLSFEVTHWQSYGQTREVDIAVYVIPTAFVALVFLGLYIMIKIAKMSCR